jgi:hypothetical protein
LAQLYKNVISSPGCHVLSVAVVAGGRAGNIHIESRAVISEQHVQAESLADVARVGRLDLVQNVAVKIELNVDRRERPANPRANIFVLARRQVILDLNFDVVRLDPLRFLDILRFAWRVFVERAIKPHGLEVERRWLDLRLLTQNTFKSLYLVSFCALKDRDFATQSFEVVELGHAPDWDADCFSFCWLRHFISSKNGHKRRILV